MDYATLRCCEIALEHGAEFMEIVVSEPNYRIDDLSVIAGASAEYEAIYAPPLARGPRKNHTVAVRLYQGQPVGDGAVRVEEVLAALRARTGLINRDASGALSR